MAERPRVRGTTLAWTLAALISAPTPGLLAAETEPAATPEQERSEEQTAQSDDPVVAEEAEPPTEEQTTAQGSARGGMRLTVILPLVGGGVLLAGGALVGLMASTDEQNLVGMRPGAHRWDDVEQLHASAETKATAANALYGTGGLALGVGLVLWLVTDPPASTSVRVGPGGVGWGGSF